MAWSACQLNASFLSSGNLSAKQYRLVQAGTAAGTVALVTAATQDPIGVLQTVGTTGGGDAVNVCVYGITKVYKDSTAAAITYGDPLVPTTAGNVKTSTGGVSSYTVGIALETMAAGSTGIINMLLTHAGKGSSGT